MNAIQKVIKIVGSQNALAKRLGTSQQRVNYWVKTGKVPAEVVISIEKATEGKVRKHELRPDLYSKSA
jgi:DNA-binding transcriptional regulator YdaS (Cro superfamily)